MRIFRTLSFLMCFISLKAAASEDLLSVFNQALTYDANLAAAQATFDAERSAYQKSWSRVLPEINATASTFDNRQKILSSSQGGGISNFNSHDYRIQLNQPLFRAERWVDISQTNQQKHAAKANYDANRLALMFKVSERYFDVLSNQSTLDFAKKEQEALKKELDEAKIRFEVGSIAITDVHEAQAQYDLAVANTIAAQNALQNAHEALKEITGIYPSQLATLTDTLEITSPHPKDIQHWTRLALQKNYAIQSKQFEVASNKRVIYRKHSDHLPDVDLVARYSYTVTGGRFGNFKSKDEAIGLEVNLPIFASGFVLLDAKEAKHRYEQSYQELEALRRETNRQVREAYLGVIANISQINALKQAVKSNESALEAAKAGYTVGSRTIIDVLNTQSRLFEAEDNLVQAKHDYILGMLRLKELAGILTEHDLTEINNHLIASYPHKNKTPSLPS